MGVYDEGEVSEEWGFNIEHFVEHDMFGGRSQPFEPSDYVCDAHCVVVNDVCEVVCGKPVTFHEDLIVDD